MSASAAAAVIIEQVDPLDVFFLRCEARALLFEAGDLDLHDAVDILQADAMTSGLVDLIGQDEVQAIMAAAFYPVDDAIEADVPSPSFIPQADDMKPRALAERDVASAAQMQRAEDEIIRRHRSENGPATSTIAALQYVISQKNPEMLRAWLATRSREELRAFKSMMVPK